MSLLIDQLNTDNDVLYLIGDIVTKFKQETEKNKQVYNGIVDDLNYVFHTIDRRLRSVSHYSPHRDRFTIFQLHSFINMYRRCRYASRNAFMWRLRDEQPSHIYDSRFRRILSGYKYTRYEDDEVKHPYSMGNLHGYIGCSYPKVHLSDKLPRAIKNWVHFYHIHRYRYEDIQNKVCRHKGGINGWYACQ
jgi:hypothetical protein